MNIKDLDALLASAKLPEKTVVLCLRGDLQADWENLDRELIEIRSQSSGTLAGNPDEAVLAEKIRALQVEMAKNSLTLRFRALPRREFRKMVLEYPPREGNEGDQQMGMNSEAFFDALIVKSLVDPVIPEAKLNVLLDGLTDAQWSQLHNATWSLNRQDVSVPFSYTASRISPGSGATSKQQSD